MKQRVIASLVLAPLVVASVVLSWPYLLFGLALVALTLGFWELRNLTGAPKALPVVTLIGLGLPFFATEISPNRDATQLAIYCFLFFVLGAVFAWVGVGKYSGSAATTDLAGLWIASPLSCIVLLHNKATPARMFTEGHQLLHTGPLLEPRSVLLLVFLPVWVGDIAGLLVGKKFGRKPLWPAISPNKTVAGAVANLVASVLCAVALSFWIQNPPLFTKPISCYLTCGAMAGVLGQAGDLFESYLKRRKGMKDSGSVIPGHGGVLDRIDSLLFSAPFVVLTLLLWPS